MKGKTKKIVLAVAVIGAIAAGGAAFTAANTVPDSVAGYGTSTVSGADATSVLHTLSADGTHITATDLVLTGDHSADTVKASFGADNPVACGTPVYDAVGDTSAVNCDWTVGATVAGHLTDTDADSFNVAVTGPSH
jgi:hypothetical protein